MAKWLYVVENNCADAAREAEFDKWFNKIHLPDILETQGFIKAIRYENTKLSEGKGKFLSIYEIETDDIDKVMKAHNDNMERKRAGGRMSELGVVVSRGLYRQLDCLSK